MSKFTPEEIAYLQSQHYGRLATVSQNGEGKDDGQGFLSNTPIIQGSL
jgi:hypothetical protein